jgi:hypothetical protein
MELRLIRKASGLEEGALASLLQVIKDLRAENQNLRDRFMSILGVQAEYFQQQRELAALRTETIMREIRVGEQPAIPSPGDGSGPLTVEKPFEVSGPAHGT